MEQDMHNMFAKHFNHNLFILLLIVHNKIMLNMIVDQLHVII